MAVAVVGEECVDGLGGRGNRALALGVNEAHRGLSCFLAIWRLYGVEGRTDTDDEFADDRVIVVNSSSEGPEKEPWSREYILR
jgi:hypothetical protein